MRLACATTLTDLVVLTVLPEAEATRLPAGPWRDSAVAVSGKQTRPPIKPAAIMERKRWAQGAVIGEMMVKLERIARWIAVFSLNITPEFTQIKKVTQEQ